MRWTKEEDDLVKINFPKGNKNSIIYLFKNRTWNGIKLRAQKLKVCRDVFYSKNELFFEIPNLINCWLSGYIAGDANLSVSGKHKTKKISFELKLDDIDLLYEIKRMTGYSGKIGNRKRKFKIKNYRENPKKLFYEGYADMAFMHVYSANKWHDDLLKNWNIIPKKSKRLIAPNITDLRLSLAFIAGNICADGNINYNFNKKKNSHNLNITFLGTEIFLAWIKDKLNEIVIDAKDSSVRKERKGSELFCYKIASIKSYLISKMILSLDIYYMKRKWDIAAKFIKMVENFEVSSRFISRLRRSLTPEIIDFVKGTNQEFPEDFLMKIGYLDKKDEISNSQSSNLPVNNLDS